MPVYSGNGEMGRPAKWFERDVVNAILYVPVDSSETERWRRRV